MSTELKTPKVRWAPAPTAEGKKRQPWRQHLVNVERGLTHGMRAGSSFFAQFFAGIIIVTAGFLLKISLMEWAIIGLAVSVVITAELFNQVIIAIMNSVGHLFDESAKKAMTMGTAAVFVSATGALFVTCVIFGQKIYHSLF